MPHSKVDEQYDFNEKKWVVSLINTGSGTNGKFGGHIKIIVEGIKKDNSTNLSNLFVAEFHIMEAEGIIQKNWTPQFLSNTKSKYEVIFSEREEYKDEKEKQYKNAHSKSWHCTPVAVMNMIDDIKSEQQRAGIYQNSTSNFQYAGNWCIYSYNGGHNCTSWAEEKLKLAGAGNGRLLTDSSKAVPELHVTCSLI